ncbi:hypothetical protein COV93_07330 [Candidatus Woesearchaeota archaeon CG11_big_fil_rev_8_21_14_0_20_43_8]|nr:MAG: hypothetical protein COV93_07330 [Candidatus Woesearchaeota archaeon CG11_big_fil_rev_8_21_14_0_20_43_8]PIO08835.1 MAG: hypothetical protein COT47_01015 [Candidatus Woesearchaeota archaeon CG08_land_8_20_14_0_20_43_7]
MLDGRVNLRGMHYETILERYSNVIIFSTSTSSVEATRGSTSPAEKRDEYLQPYDVKKVHSMAKQIAAEYVLDATEINEEESAGLGSWIREKMFGKPKTDEERRENIKELSRAASAMNVSTAPSEDESRGFGQRIRDFIFGKKAEPKGRLDPDAVEIYGEEKAKQMQLMKEAKEKQGPSEESEPEPEDDRGFGQRLRDFFFGKKKIRD